MTKLPTRIRIMPIEEFFGAGYLQELNRQFLHPLGLALMAVTDTNGDTGFEVWDCRDEPTGITCASFSAARAAGVLIEMDAKEIARRDALGYFIQPVDAPS